MNAKRIAQKSRLRPLLALALLALTAAGGWAQDADSIVREVDRREASESSLMTLSMRIDSGSGGAAREYSLRITENEAGDSLVEFLAPRSVQGMRVLGVGDGSWVYFPSTGRVRKIGAQARSGSVQGIGGDFSYEDLGGGTLAEDYLFTLLADKDGTWVLEGRRAREASAYDAVRITVEKESYRMLRAEFSLESKGGFFKALELSEFRDFDGRTRATVMVMKNLKELSSTEVRLLDARFGLAVEAGRFDPARLGR